VLLLLVVGMKQASCAKLGGPIPQPFGTNIHFTSPQVGELEMLKAGGFHTVRMDLGWTSTERAAGVYDFLAFDTLVQHCDQLGIKILFILDYTNPLYDGNRPVHTDKGRQAMAAWAVAAVKRYQGKQYIWEMWNEPNGAWFWPNPNGTDYALMATAVGKAVKMNFPNEIFIGPAMSGFDWNWLTLAFEHGVLEYFDYVSVHPYRNANTPPETATADYNQLAQMIVKYAPSGKSIPIISGEWGYSSAWFNEVDQGKFLPRMFLNNLINGVPLSIWYDWKNDGNNASDSESSFGTVDHDYRSGQNPPFAPKPAYTAAQAFYSALDGLTFAKKLSAQNYVVLFNDATNKPKAFVVWSSQHGANTSEQLILTDVFSTPYPCFQVTNWEGKAADNVCPNAAGSITVPVMDAPYYFRAN